MNRLSFLVLVPLIVSCGGAKIVTRAVPAAASAESLVSGLERSHFSKSPRGHLSEGDLQRILAASLSLELPARVGVLPVTGAADWRGPSPDLSMMPQGAQELASALPRGDLFTLVTEMLPIPSGALGMEALREVAARYKLRYILLYGERVRRRTHVNAWAAGYVTLVGAFFLPGSTLSVDGYVEASLFDVKTGLLLFTVRRRVHASERSNQWYRDDKLDELQAVLATQAADELAADVTVALRGFAAAVSAESQRQTDPPAGAPSTSPLVKPTVAPPPAPSQSAPALF